MKLFLRMDLTKNKVYSISTASKKVVATLSEPLTINVFFTKDLPSPHNNTERYLHDLLAEYAIQADKFFNYRFFDVSPEEGETSDKTKENQQLASNYGIHPIQIQAIDKDEVKFQKAYMARTITTAVTIRETDFRLSTFDANPYARTDSLFDLLLVTFLTLGRPKIIIPAGIRVREKSIAANTPNAVKIPKYLIG